MGQTVRGIFHGAEVAHKPEIKDYPAKLRRLFNAVPLVFARSQSLIERLIQLVSPEKIPQSHWHPSE